MRNLLKWPIFVLGGLMVFSVSAAVIDINTRDIKGSQILLDRVPDEIDAGQVSLVVFQRKTNCSPDVLTGVFGLKVGLSFSQLLRQRYCGAIASSLRGNPPFLVYNRQPLRTFAATTLVADLLPTTSVSQTLSELGERAGSTRYTMLVDWYAAHMDENSKFTHLVFEILLFDNQTKQRVWHSMASTYGLTSSDGSVAQADLVQAVNSMIGDIGRSILMRGNFLNLKMDGARVLPSDQSDTAQLTLINDYYDSGYNTYGQPMAFYKLPDANATPENRIDAYPSLPPNSVGYFRLAPGHYALKGTLADHYNIEVVEGRNQTLKMTRGLFNRLSLSVVGDADVKPVLAKTRNAFFPDNAKQQAILVKATWSTE